MRGRKEERRAQKHPEIIGRNKIKRKNRKEWKNKRKDLRRRRAR